MTRTTTHGLALLGATALLLTACGESSTDAMGDDTAQVCDDLDAYVASLRHLAGTIGPDATVAEVQAARDEAREAEQTLTDSLSEVTDDRTDDVAQSWDALVTALDGVDDDATLSDAAAELRTAAQGVVDATTSVGEDLDCS
ncbi:hypothetical protein ACH436_13880 [Isoptericola sp. NPDC019693]|uniref:hypothetical protein n=1 Tax=Isoptericola sp. NPDC019693 TaxID=3364009 RepID=UPI00378F8900